MNLSNTFSGPYGEQDEEQIFVQKVVPEIDTLYVRLASNGKRFAIILFRPGNIKN